jgi:hypothetical protein
MHDRSIDNMAFKSKFISYAKENNPYLINQKLANKQILKNGIKLM